MDILSLYLIKPTHKYAIRPWARLFPRFASLFNFEASALLQNHFKLDNTFGYKPVLKQSMACPWSRSRSRWDFHFHSYVLTIYVRLY